jgi:hypothetical protein
MQLVAREVTGHTAAFKVADLHKPCVWQIRHGYHTKRFASKHDAQLLAPRAVHTAITCTQTTWLASHQATGRVTIRIF